MAEPFVATVVGSMPKPAWLMEQLPLNAEGKQVHGKGGTGAEAVRRGTEILAAEVVNARRSAGTGGPPSQPTAWPAAPFRKAFAGQGNRMMAYLCESYRRVFRT